MVSSIDFRNTTPHNRTTTIARNDLHKDLSATQTTADRAAEVNSQTAATCDVVFFLSGAAALMLEVSWSRQIQLLLGHTNQASSLVLAGYFIGLSIGGLVAGRILQHVNPLTAYGVAELIVGVWAFCIPSVLEFHSQTFAQSSLSVACFVTLLPATVAMGTTLPLTVECLVRAGMRSSRVSRIYGLNTIGAVVGLVVSTGYLLVSVGVTSTSFVAALIALVCATAAFVQCWLSPFAGWPSRAVDRRQSTALEGYPAKERIPTMVSRRSMAISAFSGCMILALEVLYLQMFSLVFHNSTYTFGLVLSVFLLALAAGAWLETRFCEKFSPQVVLAYCPVVGCLLVLTSVCVFVRFTGLKYFDVGATHFSYLAASSVLVSAVVLCPVVVLGMILPAVWAQSFSEQHQTSRAVAVTAAVNSLAAAIGAVGTVFVVIPNFGLWGAFAGLAIAGCVASCVLLTNCRHLRAAVSLGSLTLLLAGIVGISPGAERWAVSSNEVLVKRWNSSYGFIDVVRELTTGDLKIRQNLHYRHGSTGRNAGRIRRMGHMPLLLHSSPRQVAFIGLGTGITAGSAVAHEQLESIAVVELIPQVVEAARLLADANASILVDSRTTIHIDDARHFLQTTKRQFDVIVSDLFVPWESETGHLYSVQHLECATRCLNAGGLYCQWIPLYQLGSVEFELIADSFASVFPSTTVWWGNLQSNRGVIALVGSQDRLSIDIEQLDRRIEAIRQTALFRDSALAGGIQLYGRFAGAWENHVVRPLNTDEFPRVEFLTPASHCNQTLLQGERLSRYFDGVLRKLPSGTVYFDFGERTFLSEFELREQHRFLLRR